MTSLQIVTVVGNPRPDSRTHTLARTLAAELASTWPGAGVSDVDLAVLGPRVLDQADEAAAAAVKEVLAADVLVIASPTYKATYSGLLKAFLDRLGTGSLAGQDRGPDPARRRAQSPARRGRALHAPVARTRGYGAGPRPVRAGVGGAGLRRLRGRVGGVVRTRARGRGRACGELTPAWAPGGRLCRSDGEEG